MFDDESDNYSAEKLKQIIISGLYSDNDFIGYQKKIVFLDNCYRKKIYDVNKHILSNTKYSVNNILISGDIYQDDKIIQHIETANDSDGTRHEIVFDSNNKILSHKKYDRFNRFAGGGVYDNGVLIGSKNIRYTENGVYETAYDDHYHILLDTKIDPAMYSEPEQQNITEIVLEKHIISHTKDGKIYKTVYNGQNQVISKAKLIKTPTNKTAVQPTQPKPLSDTAKAAQTAERAQKNNKILMFIRKIFCQNTKK